MQREFLMHIIIISISAPALAVSKCQPNSTVDPKWSNCNISRVHFGCSKKSLLRNIQKDPDFWGTEFHSELCQLCLCLEVASPVAARRHGVVGHAGSLALVETKRHRFTGLHWSENNVGCPWCYGKFWEIWKLSCGTRISSRLNRLEKAAQ